MRVLVTGARGQLGTDLLLAADAAGDAAVGLGSDELDVGDRDAVAAAVRAHAPDAIVNAGAWTAVDDCEADPDRAMRVNGLAVRWLAEAAAATGAHLVQVSTDYVFDGTKDGPYDEWDATNPQSSYGRSKLAGEQEALGVPGAAVVRTSWVCGAHGRNMVRTVLALRDRDSLAFVDDQRGKPTFTSDLAPLLLDLARERARGVFHATNEGEVSWYEFVRAVLDAAGADPDVVRPISTAELDPPRPAPRPANSVLDNRALRLWGRPPLPHYRETLGEVVDQLVSAERT